MRLLLGVGLAGGVFYLAGYREHYYHSPHSARTEAGDAVFQKGGTVAVVWPDDKCCGFLHGVRMAWEEISQRGPLAGKIKLREFYEGGHRFRQAAARAAADSSVLAVLGHESSESAVAAALLYQSNGILFLTPMVTEPRLTSFGFRYLFRLTPSDREISASLARLAKDEGWTRLGVIYARNEHGESFAPHFVAQAEEAGLTVSFMRSYLPHADPSYRQDFRPLIADFANETYDAVVIADRLPRAGWLVADLRSMGVTAPVLGGDKLDSALLWKTAGAAANGVYVASAVDPDAASPAAVRFRREFQRRYGSPPDYEATQGYEAYRLLVEAWEGSRSGAPVVVATTLRTRPWKGLFGEYAFTAEGEIRGREISIKRMKDGDFERQGVEKF
jgi:branched-chain amino acid transport system substrate-binding protein